MTFARCKHWFLAGIAVAGVTSTGCVNCRHTGFAESLRVFEGNPVPPLVRQRVYLFMMNGHDRLELAGMTKLRDELCRAGFPKVYYAQEDDVSWYYQEMRRLARDEPDARMVLLGYGSSAESVINLARTAVADQLPLDSVIFLDPSQISCDLAGTLPIPSVGVRSHNWTAAPELIVTHEVLVPIGHVSLPRHPETLVVIVDQMIASASRVVLPTIDGLPHLPLRDKPEPTPRGTDAALFGVAPPGWDYFQGAPPFLNTERGPGVPVVPVPAAIPPETPPGEALPPPRVVPEGVAPGS